MGKVQEKARADCACQVSMAGGVHRNTAARVPVVRLDTFVLNRTANANRGVLYIKVDVEGGENDVLAGMHSLLRAQVPFLLPMVAAEGRPGSEGRLPRRAVLA